MSGENRNSLVIETFAKVCESLNEYAQQLRRVEAFPKITTGADIRYLKQGWKLQKFVEAQINASEGFWAGWWIELCSRDQGWVVSSSVSISHTDVHIELDEAEIDSVDELVQCLNSALEHLTKALDNHDGFKQAVMNRRE